MTKTSEPSAFAELVDTFRTVAWALLIALVLRVIVFQPNTIPSASMQPAVQEGDYVVITKFDYGWSRHSIPFSPPLFHGRLFGRAPARGDVVVFHLLRDQSITYIKRIIGLPGDRVRLAGGVVYVNDRPIPRMPLGLTQDPTSPDVTVMQVRETKADGTGYITFDRGPGHDGDDTPTYVVPDGYYFALGDNRDNSLDSRWPSQYGVGFIPAENLLGKARFVALSWRQGASVLKPWTWLNLDPKRFLRPLS